jgi:peptide/nickel transport system ATP-binding protein
VLELLDEIRQRLNLAVLFITHDLRVAAQICDYVAVSRSSARPGMSTPRRCSPPRPAATGNSASSPRRDADGEAE